MSESIKILDFNDALNLIKKNTMSAATAVWIPSLSRSFKFRQLTTQQHKELLKCAINASVLKSEMNIVLYNILKDCLIDDANVDQFTILDKIAICYQLRRFNSGNFVKCEFNVDGVKHYNNFDIDIAIHNFEQNYSSVVLDSVINSSNLQVRVSIPTLKTQKEIDEYVVNNHIADLHTISDEDPNSLNNFLAEIIIYNIIQFIDEIDINGSTIAFNKLTVDERIQLVNQLDKSTFDKISKFVSEFNQLKETLINNKFEYNGTTINFPLDLNSNFFVTE